MITVSLRKIGPGAYVGRVSVDGSAFWRSPITSEPKRARSLATEVAKALREAARRAAA